MENKKNKGVALIAVIVMIILFSSLIMVIVLAATMSIRRAYFYQDKLKALEIAENAIQDVFNWMNYRAYNTEYYPSWYAIGDIPNGPTKVYFNGLTFTSSPSKINAPYIPEKGECFLEFLDDNGENKDTITAIGKYRGKTAKISVNVRGVNGYDNPNHKNYALRLRDTLPFSSISINFEPSGANPSIPLPDKGEVFGDRGNGYKYGWDQDRTSYVYDRDILPNTYQQYDTLVIMSGAKWEIEVPNWYYQVIVDCGDPNDPECDDYNHDLLIEGQLSQVLTPNFSVLIPPSQIYRYKRHIINVTVADGRLTIEPAPGSNPRICYLQIRPNSGANWAIPEAFNKHLAYTKTISGNTGANQILIDGNITYNDWQANLNYNTNSRKTFTSTTNFSIPTTTASITIPAATTLPEPTWPPTPSQQEQRFKDSNGNTPYDPASGYGTNSQLRTINGGNDPYTGDGTNEFYTFSNLSNLSSGAYFFEKADNTAQLQIKFTNNSNPVIPSGTILKAGAYNSNQNADIIIDVTLGSNTQILGQLMAERNIEITKSIPVAIGTSGVYTLSAKNNITIDPNGDLTINGNIYSENGTISITGASGRTIIINGNLYAKNGNISISGQGTITINGIIYAKNQITINGTNLNLTISDEVRCPGQVIIGGSGNINVNKDIKGGLQTSGSVILKVNGSVFSSVANIPISIGGTGNININGVISAAGNITISNSKLTVDARNINYPGAICRGGNGDITINASPTIHLGQNQYSAIFIDSGTGNVNINARLNPNYHLATGQTATNQMAIINRSISSTSSININAEVIGAVYSRTNITIGTNGKVKGVIITDQTLTLNGGEITYDSAPFKKNTEVYKGFVGGRRKYLPVIGSWRIEW
ncbi:MAG: carbohydrate-binding domain-containing protein [bacterium]|nr:carbohydrate-binding domain-containing protein [bacterium]MDW8164310.1 hypothetical protein [Candidatus Omnitrophota bacterium]